MNEELEKKAKLLREELLKRQRILADGISDDAMEVLREMFELDKPVYQLKDSRGFAIDIETVKLMSAIRDGEQGAIKRIIVERNLGKKQLIR